MTTAFRTNANGTDFFNIADDSTNYIGVLNNYAGSYGSALWINNLDSANVAYVAAGWDPENLDAIVPVVGTPGAGLPVLPGQTVILSVATTQQATPGAQLYFAAAVDGTATVVVSQGSVD
jgi:hypothetical protein